MAIRKDDSEKRNSSLKIRKTKEEVYRRWLDGKEVTRFDADRTNVELRLNLLEKIYLKAGRQVRGRQALMNRDETKATGFDFSNLESENEITLGWQGAKDFFEVNYHHCRDDMNGNIELQDSAKDAIGGNPDVRVVSKRFARNYKWVHRGSDLSWRIKKGWFEGGEQALVKPVNMFLKVPLDHSGEYYEFEFSYNNNDKYQPFLRFALSEGRGSGQSYRDGKFRFGFSDIDTYQKLKAAGLVVKGRHPWFVELQKHEFAAWVRLKNNLITLNPLMLFGINEITQTERVFKTEPFGFRVGGLRKFKSFSLYLQYGFVQVDTRRETRQNKISDFRKKSETLTSYVRERTRLHRLNAEFVREDKAGSWRMIVNLIGPEVKEKKDEVKAGGPPPGTPSPVAEPSEKFRGGWQLNFIREFIF